MHWKKRKVSHLKCQCLWSFLFRPWSVGWVQNIFKFFQSYAVHAKQQKRLKMKSKSDGDTPRRFSLYIQSVYFSSLCKCFANMNCKFMYFNNKSTHLVFMSLQTVSLILNLRWATADWKLSRLIYKSLPISRTRGLLKTKGRQYPAFSGLFIVSNSLPFPTNPHLFPGCGFTLSYA